MPQEAMCKLNATTKRPDIHDKCLLLEFSRVTHSELWCAKAKRRSLFLSVFHSKFVGLCPRA